MNKKILSIIFTLFLAGLLSISCSNKGKTGPGDKGDNGGGTTTTIPESGTGIDSGYRGRMYFTGNTSYEEGTVTVTLDGAPLYTFNKQGEFQVDMPKGDGDVLVKMPKLTEMGFTGDIIKIPSKNIIDNGDQDYTIKTRYTFGDAATQIVTFDFQSEKFNLRNSPYFTMKMKVVKKTVKVVEGKEEVTEEKTYVIETKPNLKQVAIDGYGSLESIDESQAILPKY